ncbi:MAG: YiiX/YebB-like N1pC/P60 family cysteine hydrolase [Rhizomicrobium sp.]|nr:YiiX/YebB-like N1pC/P60 family cysteine hydrolase [Rhizomicrobium sp.]
MAAAIVLFQDSRVGTGSLAPMAVIPVVHDLRPGDVVFVTLPGAFWARLASRWSLPQYRHGHVGMVVTTGDDPFVVHASGNPAQTDAKVVRVRLKEFARGAQRLDVFRPNDAAAALRAAQAADEFALRAVKFDTEFSLESRDRLYCTELIWRALNSGYGRDTVPIKSHFAGREAVFLSDLETSQYLRLVETVRAF